MKRAFNRVNTNDRILEQIQTNVDLVIQSIQQCPELTPVYIEAAVAASTDNIVKHNLGRAYKYLDVVAKDADVNVWISSTTNNSKHQQIILKANASANITIRLS